MAIVIKNSIHFLVIQSANRIILRTSTVREMHAKSRKKEARGEILACLAREAREIEARKSRRIAFQTPQRQVSPLSSKICNQLKRKHENKHQSYST